MASTGGGTYATERSWCPFELQRAGKEGRSSDGADALSDRPAEAVGKPATQHKAKRCSKGQRRPAVGRRPTCSSVVAMPFTAPSDTIKERTKQLSGPVSEMKKDVNGNRLRAFEWCAFVLRCG